MSTLPGTMEQEKRNEDTFASNFSLSLSTQFSDKKLVSFTRALAVLVKARLPLVRALETLEKQMSGDERDLIRKLKKAVEQGKGLSSSLEQYPSIFPPSYIYLIEVGEETGRLAEMLERIADTLEKKQQLRQKVRSAMMYPGLVFLVSLGAFLFLLTVVVPSFSELYADFEAEMPYMTSLVLDISSFFTNQIGYLIIAILAIVTSIWLAINTKAGKRVWDRLILKVPLLGSLLLKNITAEYTRTLGSLLRNGVSLTESLSLVRNTQQNTVFQEATQHFIRAVKKGESLASVMKKRSVFPAMVEEMVAVGEETAELDELLIHISESYAQEVDLKVESLTSILEPVLIVFLGIIVGSIIISLYLPIFDLMNVVQ